MTIMVSQGSGQNSEGNAEAVAEIEKTLGAPTPAGDDGLRFNPIAPAHHALCVALEIVLE
jgi:hypothetical protein